jgi:dihydrofolate reductase
MRGWKRPQGGTTFYFSRDTVQSALQKAKEAAGKKDVRISGGADIIRQYLSAGLVDEIDIQIAPLFLGGGMRLFDHVDRNSIKLEIDKVIGSPLVTHLIYNVVRP